MKGTLLLSASVHAYPTLKRKWYLQAIYNLLFRKKIRLKDDTCYYIIHNVWCPGYAHWLLEALPRLLVLQDRTKECTLLLPQNAKAIAEQTLKAFNVNKIIYFPENTNFKVSRLYLPDNPKENFHIHPEIYRGLREKYYQHYAISDEHQATNRIYISRKKSRGRKIANETEVESILSQYGFKTVYMEELSFDEQFILMAHTSHLISIHGAGLANLLFMPPKGSVLEIINKSAQEENINEEMPNVRFMYMRLCAALQINYHLVFGTPVINKGKFDTTDLVVDVDMLNKNVIQFVS